MFEAHFQEMHFEEDMSFQAILETSMHILAGSANENHVPH
jgi:hypothetical protein